MILDSDQAGEANPVWPSKALGDVCMLLRGVSYSPTDLREVDDPDAIPVLRATNIQRRKLLLVGDLVYVAKSRVKDQQMLRRGDIVVAMSSGSAGVVGKSAQLREPWRGTFGAFCGVVRSSQKANPEFLDFALQTASYREHIRRSARGTNIKNLSREHVLGYHLALPPLQEQRAIAHVLTTVERAREAAEDAAAAARALKKSLLRHLMKAARAIDSRTLGQVAELTNGKVFKASDWGRSGLPIIRIQNLNDRTAPFNYYAGPIEERYLVKSGDLLFAWSGSKGTSFGAHTWTREPGLLNQHIFKVEPRDDSVLLDYLACVLEDLTSEIESSAYGLAALVHVRKRDLAATTIPLPPIDVQRLSASSLAAVKRKVAAEEQRRDALDEVFKSLLCELLSGKRRLSPDIVKHIEAVSA